MPLCSGWIYRKHHTGPHSHLRVPLGGQRCSCCSCSFSVSFNLYALSYCQNFTMLLHNGIKRVFTFQKSFSKTYFNPFRYFIVTILFWRLVQKVNLMPPSLKDLQFGRFLKNGKKNCSPNDS